MDEDLEDDIPFIDEEPSANPIIVNEVNKSNLSVASPTPKPTKAKTGKKEYSQISASMDCRIPSTIPVLTKYTMNQETYDIDRILDPKVQKSVESGHRFSQLLNYHRQHVTPGKTSQTSQSQTISKSVVDWGTKIARQSIDMASRQKKLEEDYLKKELAACTFQPQTKNAGKGQKLSKPDEFLKKQKQYAQKSEEQFKNLKEAAEKKFIESMGTFSPNPHKTKDRSQAEPAYLRLSCPKRANTAWQETEEASSQSFYAETSVAQTQPSPVVTRNVVADLMNDARRRQEEKPEEQIPEPPKLLSNSSETALFRKFVKELDSIIAENNITDKIQYDVFVQLLLKLNFIQTEPTADYCTEDHYLMLDIWDILSQDSDTLPVKNLRTVLCAILNLYHTSLSPPETGELDEEKLYLLEDDVIKIHKQFNLLSENRLMAKSSNKNPRFKEKHAISFSFTPELTRKTLQICNKITASPTKKVDVLIGSKQVLAAKKERALLDKIEKEVSVLKSKPDIHEKPNYLKKISKQSKETYVSKNEVTQKYYEQQQKVKGHRANKLFNFAKIKKEHNEEEVEREQETQAIKDVLPCSFEPEIHPNITAKPEDQVPDANGMQKAITRVLKGREMAEVLQKKREKGAPNTEAPPKEDTFSMGAQAPKGAVYEIDVTIGDSVVKVKTAFNQIEYKVKELVRKHNMELGSEKRLVLEIQSKLVKSNLMLFATQNTFGNKKSEVLDSPCEEEKTSEVLDSPSEEEQTST